MIKEQEIKKVKELVYKYTSIKLGPQKEIMILNRLDKLKKNVGIHDIGHLLSVIEKGHHVEEFISAFTTNKTEFFRESHHFEDLRNRVFPELKNRSSISIYSSASSTGEEPYSIAITLQESLERLGVSFCNATIHATDIDPKVLERAKEGIYRYDDRVYSPEWVKMSKYFKKRDVDNAHHSLIKAKDSLKKFLTFSKLNLLSDDYPFKKEQFDIIFCRNVLIYFDQKDQQKVLDKLYSLLKTGGTLYLGHSENPLALTDKLERLGQNIFLKR